MRLIGRYLLLILGVVACSTAVVMIKASTVPPVVLASARLLIAAVLLTPVLALACRATRMTVGQLLRKSSIGAVLLALHFISWAAGARMTVAANGSLIVNMVPIVMPFLMWGMVRECITARELLGSAIAFSGVFVLTFGRLQIDPATIGGDITCFVSMLLFAAYLAVARVRNDLPSTWLYVVPL